jgi:hypothetical protein
MVHPYGNSAPIRAVRAQASAPDCLVIDGAAQALSSYNRMASQAQLGCGLAVVRVDQADSIGNAA